MADPRPASAPPIAAHENVLRAFLASPAMLAVTRRRDGVLLDANPAFLAAGDLTREEAIGRIITDLGLWIEEHRRAEYRRLLATEGRARDFEARFRNRRGIERDTVLNAEIVDIDGEKCVVVIGLDITGRRQREREQDAVYRISEATNSTTDLATLFKRLHEIIGGLMPAQNLFFALVSPDGREVSFPYYEDECSQRPAPRPRGKGLTDYVIDSKKPLLARTEELIQILAGQGYKPTGTPSAVWLGAPLIVEGRAIGVVAVQDYRDETVYGEEAKRLLTFVASQVASAVERRRSEAVQRESQDYFTKSFHASPALMLLADLASSKILETNAAFLRASGFAREEVIGRTSVDLGVWADKLERERVLAELRARGFVHGYETVFRNKAGEPRYVLLNADVFELGGRPAMLITAIDLTERRRREQVQESTYRISRAVLSGGDLQALFAEVHRIVAGLMPARNFYIALLSADGRAVSFPYFSDQHDGGKAQTPSTRPLGLGFTEYVIESGRPTLIAQADLTKILSARGDYRPPTAAPLVRLGAPMLIDGRPIGALALHDYENAHAYNADDLALVDFVAQQAAAAVRRREAEQALARAERQFRGIFENAVEGLYQSTPSGRFLRVNPALATMLGYDSPEQMIAAVNDIRAQFYIQPGRREDFLHLIQTADELSNFDSEILRRDGSRVWVSESVRVIRRPNGEPDHFEGVVIDITARREADRVLRAAKEAADEASRAKTQFLASMSHELRTPLNGILGYTQILRRDTALTEKQRGGLAVIHQSAEHLLALINDVLDLAKIEARKLELHPAEFGLPEFCQSVAEVFAPRAREKNLRLETAFAADLPRAVICDAQRLRQVLFNLLSNAVKFTQQGGVVFTIERAMFGTVRFSVSDTGPGIAEADQAKLFEPFAQVGDERQRAGGTGLGLNVSRSIVEQMGSRLHVESRVGWGTRFWFDLLLRESDSAAAPAGSTSPWRLTGYEGARRRVLVADDHEPNRVLLIDLLQPLGFELVTAQDGEEAVRVALETSPHLALLDVRMPQVDGLAAARRIREKLGDAAPVCIAISASAHDQQHANAIAAGCVAFLAKPFKDEELFVLIGRHLNLTWKLSDTTAPGETASPFPSLPFPPTPAQADQLFELASSGDVAAVRTFVQKLAAEDPRLAAFAQQIMELAARFKMKAIRTLVARYLNPPP
ncbi:MAG: PAS domain S-box protein [Candidatus Didemnitutus sp.]|nr:PAS domain S-box protein [Candidatus Didemnitutus sp.]